MSISLLIMHAEIQRKRLFYKFRCIQYKLQNVYIPNLRIILKPNYNFEDVIFNFSCPISENNIECTVCNHHSVR